MAAVIDDQPRTAGVKPSPRRRPTSRRRLLAIAVLVALLATAFFVGRVVLAAFDRSKVYVFTDASALTCEGTDVELVERSEDEPSSPAVPMLVARPGATCLFTFWIANESGSDVVIDTMRFETLGLGNGFGLTVDKLTTGAIDRDPDVDVDAVFDTDVTLSPGASQAFTVLLHQSREGCNPQGGNASFPRAPIVSVRSRGVSGHVRPTGPTFGVIGTNALHCAVD